ncbi:MAG: PfaD family polyunsaturated fatty acid/polyketide biosynthesis protein [Anaerolineaceae bacterium]|nr:PfaD family polyunsaturated fatty acid/polyketide biosynthesis protein [Anaerolineaceae bacterium]
MTQAMINKAINFWFGSQDSLYQNAEDIKECLLSYQQPVYVITDGIQSFSNEGVISSQPDSGGKPLTAMLSPIQENQFGSQSFLKDYGVNWAVYLGAMANAITSVEMVVAAGKAGILASFGAAGLSMAKLEESILAIKAALPNGPFACNLINNIYEPIIEEQTVALYLKHQVRVIEASAYLRLSGNIVHYRAAGLSRTADGSVKIANRIIAKVSRKEVAQKFIEPAPQRMLDELVQSGKITAEQAELAALVPVADDITVEADSGGHTDNRPLVSLLPTMIAYRDELQVKHQYPQAVRIGAGGGISTPASVLAAYMMGADYVVTGSINHASVESGACLHTRELLCKAGMADVIMAPCADMFEMGVKVQVLRSGTFYAMRAQKLYELYSKYESIEDIPVAEREKIEKQIFKQTLDQIWEGTKQFFAERDPQQVAKAEADPHKKMALIFRWYLGLSSRWSVIGDKEREMDYQIWCGPGMGTFNDWVKGTYLEGPQNRSVVDITRQLLRGCAYQYRVQQILLSGVQLPTQIRTYYPEKTLI